MLCILLNSAKTHWWTDDEHVILCGFTGRLWLTHLTALRCHDSCALCSLDTTAFLRDCWGQRSLNSHREQCVPFPISSTCILTFVSTLLMIEHLKEQLILCSPVAVKVVDELKHVWIEKNHCDRWLFMWQLSLKWSLTHNWSVSSLYVLFGFSQHPLWITTWIDVFWTTFSILCTFLSKRCRY